jgi:YbgC/YbaW family acyl-CoA thioester hydrolase
MADPAPFHFTHRRQVEFADTDLAGIVHFANFFRYVESAEHAFFRSLGFRPHTGDGATHHGWPRLEVSCQYLKPARFEQMLEISLRVTELRTSSLSYEFAIAGAAEHTRPLLATGRCAIIHVAIDPAAHQIRKAPIPADLRHALERLMAAPSLSSPPTT